jgi:hypothetical protein
MTVHLNSLKRSKILISAAKLGFKTYNRATCLGTFLALNMNQHSAQILRSLIAKEDQLNQMRLQQHVQYNIALHVTTLTALIAETMKIEGAEKQPI